MSGGPAGLQRQQLWIVAAIAALLTVILFTPSVDLRGTIPRLSSYSAAPGGARGLHELARRLGWDVIRSDSQTLPPPRGTTAYVVLDPIVPLTAGEVGTLLSRVRAGAGLLTVAERDTPLADSLGLRVVSRSAALPWDSTSACPKRSRFALRAPLWSVPSIEPSRRGPTSMVTFVGLQAEWMGSPDMSAVVGYPLGRGRIVVVSHPLLLANDVLRECRFPVGLGAAGFLRFLRGRDDGASRPLLVFDEFHQGYGAQPSVRKAAARVLLGTAPGRGLLHISLAGVILLVAMGPRPLPPRPEMRIERRSPLEHVFALATAYQAVGATRTVTRRLVQGLRRRLTHGGVAPAGVSDETFLRELAAAHPRAQADVDRVLASLATSITARELVATRDSIRRIEEVLGHRYH